MKEEINKINSLRTKSSLVKQIAFFIFLNAFVWRNNVHKLSKFAYFYISDIFLYC